MTRIMPCGLGRVVEFLFDQQGMETALSAAANALIAAKENGPGLRSLFNVQDNMLHLPEFPVRESNPS